jgi:ABC-2 type transport system ATP-binding protein
VSANIVEITGLLKTYPGTDHPAVNGIDLCIPQGSIFGLLGPNGAGKTTLLSMICGLLTPSSGNLTVMGLDIRRQSQAIKRRLGLVPQDLAIYPSLSALENLDFFGRMQGLRGASLRRRVDACLDIAGLREVATQRADTFSGGLKRRLNLVIGLVHEPGLLILDEPTVGIDPQSRHFIHQTLRALNAGGMSIIYTTHYMDEVENICDKLAIIDHGRIIAQGTVDELLKTHQDGAIELRTEQAMSQRLQDYIRALPHIHSITIEGKSIILKSRHPEITLRDALTALQQDHIDITSVSMGAMHLEQVFLNLTGTRLRD